MDPIDSAPSVSLGFAMPTHEHPPTMGRSGKPTADLRRVYRYRHKVNGCTVWYGVNDWGQIVGIRLVADGESDAQAVEALAILVWGLCTGKPVCT